MAKKWIREGQQGKREIKKPVLSCDVFGGFKSTLSVSIFSNVIYGIVTCNCHVRLVSRCLSNRLTFKVKLFILLMAIFQIVVPALPGDALKKQLPFRGDDGRTWSSVSKIYSHKHIGFVHTNVLSKHSIFPPLNKKPWVHNAVIAAFPLFMDCEILKYNSFTTVFCACN